MMKVKKNNLIFFILLSVCAFHSSNAIADKVIVVTENYPPYNYEHDNQVVGISTDIVK
jgi:hypothetical protein